MGKILRLFMFSFAIASFSVACKTEKKVEDTKTDSKSEQTVSVDNQAAPVLNTQASPASVGTVKHPPTKLGGLMNMDLKRNAFTTASSGLNPAHGMPGHDCSVAVGDPLPGMAKLEVNDQGQTLNPAHGMPGHDCSVAVGAPLPS